VDVTIQQLCSHANVTARHLYELFANREEVLVALHTEIIDEGAKRVLEAVAHVSPEDPWAMSEVGVSAFLHYMLDDPRRAQIICFEVMVLPQVHMQGCMTRYVDILQAYAEGLAAVGLLGTEQIHLSSVLLAGGIRELMADWLLSPDPAPIDLLIAEAVRDFALVGDFKAAPKR
jgi:AcrR family transcriptional regulator